MSASPPGMTSSRESFFSPSSTSATATTGGSASSATVATCPMSSPAPKPWMCSARAPSALPRPTAIIFTTPLWTGPEKPVCGATLFITTIPSALSASRAVKTSAPPGVLPRGTTSVEASIGAPTDSSVTPSRSSTFSCPSSVAPP